MPVQLPFFAATIAIVCMIVSGCTAVGNQLPQAHEVVRPSSKPVRNITGFSASLRCLDGLLAAYVPAGPPALIYSKGVIDKTGKNLGLDNREMLMSTISQLSARSNIFQVTDLPTNLEDAGVVDANFGLANRERAQYEIIASISQMDENVSARSTGFTLSLPDFDASVNSDQLVTVIAVDFLVSKPSSGLVLNGIEANNAIAIARSGTAGDVGGLIKKAGLFFNLSLDRSEGVYAAIRALVELSTIEVLGKLAEVPYWRCLQIAQTNPEVLTLTQRWYHKMRPQQRIRFVQQILRQRGLYQGTVNGVEDTLTRNAIARYQQAAGLIASGRIDLALYRSLISDDLGDRVRIAAQQPAANQQSLPAAATAIAVRPSLSLTTDRGPEPHYAVKESLNLQVVVSQPTYVYCFYQDAAGTISKIYPNRFQPARRLEANARVRIPDNERFSLLLDQADSREAVLCLASPKNVTDALPSTLASDLEPLALTSLEQISSLFQGLDPATLAQRQLLITVQ